MRALILINEDRLRDLPLSFTHLETNDFLKDHSDLLVVQVP